MCIDVFMKKNTDKDLEKFLTTYVRWDLSALIKSLHKKPIPTCVVHIEPQQGKTGFLEERGAWIIEFWNKVIKHNNSIEGHRTGWTSLLFFGPDIQPNDFKSPILGHRRTSVTGQLKSLALFSMIEGSFENQIMEIDNMGLQLNKLNYWDDHIYPSYYENGIEKELNST